jgi:hypothetical protein
MADAFNLSQLGNLPPELYEQQQALNRQQQMAQLLMQQGQQSPQGQMISGRYVAPSFTQNLASLAQAGVGAYLQNKGDKQALELATKLREGKLGTQQALMEALNAGDTKKALAIATADQYGAGTQFIPALIGSVIPKTPDEVAKYNYAKTPEGGGFKGSFTEFQNQMTPYQKEQLGLERQKLGMEQQKLANELGGGKLTESQGNATAFGMRAKESNALLNQLEQSGVKNTGVVRSAVASTLGMTPFIGEKLEQNVSGAMNVLPGFLGGPTAAQQSTDQARRNFVTAILRKESGAAISPSEFANEAQKYFPQPGDTDSVIRQKQNARETAIKALEIQAGPGANAIRQMPTPKLDVGGAKRVVNFNDLP